MIIDIEKKAAEYIKKKSQDNSIYITVVKTETGWCAAEQPSVKMGKPSNESSFEVHKAGDINIYLSPRLKARNNELRITLDKFLFLANLNIDGLII